MGCSVSGELKCLLNPASLASIQEEGYSINLIRFFLYQLWSEFYDSSSLILLSDFRDVFFQSNPFDYKRELWTGAASSMAVFQEAYPNKMIYRCPFNSGWIKNCYGKRAYEMVSGNMVSCSGTTIGKRDAILVYSYLITQQLNKNTRFFRNGLGIENDLLPRNDKKCIDSIGVDQGFHNFVLYSGQLEAAGIEVKLFPQGEGIVNTIGAFYTGPNALIKMSLYDWGLLKGEPGEMVIMNWNGVPSPVVHQYDRFGKLKLGFKALKDKDKDKRTENKE